jgi:alpha-beta hydrolase superfamily lysophospholipase
MEEHTARDGTVLAVRRWPVENSRASMLIIHGFGDHSGRWEHVGQFFQREGFDTSAFDLRGHGHSRGRRGDVHDWSEYLDDVEDMLSELPQTRVLYGHSLGGLIAASYAVSQRPQPDLLVLSAPGVDDNLAPSLHTMSKILGPVLPTVPVAAGIKGEQLSHDPDVASDYENDPLVLKKATLRLGLEGFRAAEETKRHLERIRIPTLTIQGSQDPVVPVSASARFLPHATRIVYEGFLHECHNELEHARVLADIADWIREQTQA